MAFFCVGKSSIASTGYRKRLHIPHCVFLAIELEVKHLQMCGFISGFSIVFSWSVSFYWCQYHTVLITRICSWFWSHVVWHLLFNFTQDYFHYQENFYRFYIFVYFVKNAIGLHWLIWLSCNWSIYCFKISISIITIFQIYEHKIYFHSFMTFQFISSKFYSFHYDYLSHSYSNLFLGVWFYWLYTNGAVFLASF